MIVQFPKFTTELDPSLTATETSTEYKTGTLRVTTTAANTDRPITLGHRLVIRTITVTEVVSRTAARTAKNLSIIPFSQCGTKLNNFTIV
jgi:hypothetical protein